MKTIIKIFCLLLCLSMIVGVFASCASKTPEAETETPKAEEKKEEKEEKQEEEPKGLKYTLLSDGSYEVSVGTEIAAQTIEIPATYQTKKVTSIAESAFYGCTKLKNIVIPNTVTNIGDGAFEECTALGSITLPASIAKIGEGVFGYCTSLTNISVASQNQKYESIDGNLYHKENYELVHYAPGKVASTFEIPYEMRSIGAGAFLGCANLTSITIPDSVTSIGDGAFRDCDALTSIWIPGNVLRIEEECFRSCDRLAEVTMPDTIKSIGKAAFKDCRQLTAIEIPAEVTTIEASAFENCVLLETILLSDGVTKIGNDAFYHTKFYDTESNWENKVLYLGNYLIKAMAAETDTLTPIVGEYSVKAGTKTIADGAFYSCVRLTGVTIPEGVESIGEGAFYYCIGLTTITIPKSVTEIGDFAFEFCNGLTDIYFEGTQEEWQAISKDTARLPSSVEIHFA